MASNYPNRLQRKRTAKKIFSPSDSDRYGLIFFNATDQYKIIKYSEIITEKEGEVELKNGNIGTLVMMGSHIDCRSALNSRTELLKDKQTFDEDEEEDGDDDGAGSDGQEEDNDQIPNNRLTTTASFLQRPHRGFHTPAARRRNSPTRNSICSPIVSRHAIKFSDNLKTNRRPMVSDLTTSFNYPRQTTNRSSHSGVFDDDLMEADTNPSLNRLQETSENQLSLIRSLKDDVAKLTKKMSRFSNSLSFKNDQLSLYQDPNDKENYPDVIDYKGDYLLDISGRDPADYARKILRKLFTSGELATSVLPSRYDHLYVKKPLDKNRFDLLNKAIQAHYRISKNNYSIFYNKVIQKTLSDCIYNEGTRKQSRQGAVQRQMTTINTTTLAESTAEMEPSSLMSQQLYE